MAMVFQVNLGVSRKILPGRLCGPKAAFCYEFYLCTRALYIPFVVPFLEIPILARNNLGES